MDGNNVGFLGYLAVQMFYEKGNPFNTFVRGCTQCTLVIDTDCKQFTKNLHRVPLSERHSPRMWSECDVGQLVLNLKMS